MSIICQLCTTKLGSIKTMTQISARGHENKAHKKAKHWKIIERDGIRKRGKTPFKKC